MVFHEILTKCGNMETYALVPGLHKNHIMYTDPSSSYSMAISMAHVDKKNVASKAHVEANMSAALNLQKNTTPERYTSSFNEVPDMVPGVSFTFCGRFEREPVCDMKINLHISYTIGVKTYTCVSGIKIGDGVENLKKIVILSGFVDGFGTPVSIPRKRDVTLTVKWQCFDCVNSVHTSMGPVHNLQIVCVASFSQTDQVTPIPCVLPTCQAITPTTEQPPTRKSRLNEDPVNVSSELKISTTEQSPSQKIPRHEDRLDVSNESKHKKTRNSTNTYSNDSKLKTNVYNKTQDVFVAVAKITVHIQLADATMKAIGSDTLTLMSEPTNASDVKIPDTKFVESFTGKLETLEKRIDDAKILLDELKRQVSDWTVVDKPRQSGKRSQLTK